MMSQENSPKQSAPLAVFQVTQQRVQALSKRVPELAMVPAPQQRALVERAIKSPMAVVTVLLMVMSAVGAGLWLLAAQIGAMESQANGSVLGAGLGVLMWPLLIGIIIVIVPLAGWLQTRALRQLVSAHQAAGFFTDAATAPPETASVVSRLGLALLVLLSGAFAALLALDEVAALLGSPSEPVTGRDLRYAYGFFASVWLGLTVGVLAFVWWMRRVFARISSSARRAGGGMQSVSLVALWYASPGLVLLLACMAPAFYLGHWVKQEAYCANMLRLDPGLLESANLWQTRCARYRGLIAAAKA